MQWIGQAFEILEPRSVAWCCLCQFRAVAFMVKSGSWLKLKRVIVNIWLDTFLSHG